MFYFTIVSVPIRGLFNLTLYGGRFIWNMHIEQVSVPIRGLFNLTNHAHDVANANNNIEGFRPHQGII